MGEVERTRGTHARAIFQHGFGCDFAQEYDDGKMDTQEPSQTRSARYRPEVFKVQNQQQARQIILTSDV